MNGDKTDVADEFVSVAYPFGARVAIQDGKISMQHCDIVI